MKEKRTLRRVLLGGLTLNLFLLGVAVSFYYVLIQPTFTNFISTSREIASLEEYNASIRSSAEEIEQRNNELATLKTAFLNLDNAVPFITLLDTIAAESGVTISIKTASTGDPAGTKQEEFNISVLGTLANIMQFTKRVELMPYFADISSVTISPIGNRIQSIMRLTVLTL